jgi:hypothetical protein
VRTWQACLWGVQVLHGVLQGAPWEPRLGQGSKGNKEAGKGWVACATKTTHGLRSDIGIKVSV